MRAALPDEAVGAVFGLEQRELLAEQLHRYHRLAFQFGEAATGYQKQRR